EAERERDRLDAFGAGEQLPAYEPKPSQSQIAVQAHAAIAQDCIMHRAHRYADLLRQFLAVNWLSEIALQHSANFLKDPELPGGVGVGRPSRGDNLGQHAIDAGEQRFPDRSRRLAHAWGLTQVRDSR